MATSRRSFTHFVYFLAHFCADFVQFAHVLVYIFCTFYNIFVYFLAHFCAFCAICTFGTFLNIFVYFLTHFCAFCAICTFWYIFAYFKVPLCFLYYFCAFLYIFAHFLCIFVHGFVRWCNPAFSCVNRLDEFFPPTCLFIYFSLYNYINSPLHVPIAVQSKFSADPTFSAAPSGLFHLIGLICVFSFTQSISSFFKDPITDHNLLVIFVILMIFFFK